MTDLDDPRRLAEFRSTILALDDDGVLEECVRDAAARARAPISLVTFVMSKIQLFRAAVGLPPELEASRATSRCDSFCQFVVKNEAPFLVADARNDPRVPKAMVNTYGMAAYLGVPIRVGGQVLGSLCVADGKPRDWDTALIEDLLLIAARVSRRLDRMASRSVAPPQGPTSALEQLVRDVSSLATGLQRSLSEIAPLVRLATLSQNVSPDALTRAMGLLAEASGSYDGVLDQVGKLLSASEELERRMIARRAS